MSQSAIVLGPPPRILGFHLSVADFVRRRAFTGLGEGDDLVGDGLPNVIGAVPDPQSDAARIIVLTQVDGGRPSRASGLEIKNSTLVPA